MKTMKLTIMMVFATLLFIGCSSSNEKPDTPEEEKEETLSVVKYSVKDVGDMSKLFNFNVTYTNDKGVYVTEENIALPWIKEYSNMELSLPTEVKLTLSYTAKTQIPVQDSYKTGSDIYCSYQTSKSIYKIESITNSSTVAPQYIDKYIERETEEGNATSIDFEVKK